MNLTLERAIGFAVHAHAGQFRDGDNALPYVTHPLDVLHKLRYVGLVTTESTLTAAVLHDVLEETAVSADEIRAEFGDDVAAVVLSVTRREPTEAETAGMNKDQVWQLRSDILLGEIAEMDLTARTIKLADRLSNLEEALRTRTGKKLARYLAQTERILEIVPRSVNAPLHRAIRDLLAQGR